MLPTPPTEAKRSGSIMLDSEPAMEDGMHSRGFQEAAILKRTSRSILRLVQGARSLTARAVILR